MKIDWKTRFKNPIFVAQIGLSIITPIIAYLGLGFGDIVSFDVLFDILKKGMLNPYVIGLCLVSVYNAISNPTTNGYFDK